MTDKLVYAEPTAGQFIRELHCWIATYEDGTEGIIAGGLEGVGVTPLLSSHRHLAETLEPIARLAQQAAMQQRDRMISVRLVTFTSTEGTRQ